MNGKQSRSESFPPQCGEQPQYRKKTYKYVATKQNQYRFPLRWENSFNIERKRTNMSQLNRIGIVSPSGGRTASTSKENTQNSQLNRIKNKNQRNRKFCSMHFDQRSKGSVTPQTLLTVTFIIFRGRQCGQCSSR